MSNKIARGGWSGFGATWIWDPSQTFFHVWDIPKKLCSSQSYPKNRCSTILPSTFSWKYPSVKNSVCDKKWVHSRGNPTVRRRSVCDEKWAFSHGNLPVSEEKVFVTNNEHFLMGTPRQWRRSVYDKNEHFLVGTSHASDEKKFVMKNEHLLMGTPLSVRKKCVWRKISIFWRDPPPQSVKTKCMWQKLALSLGNPPCQWQ